MTLPTFIVIGPGKTGTTWLYQCLAEHPEIKLARGTKETVFFNSYYGRGLDWYQRFFEGCERARAIGEVSNNYFFSPDAPARIAKDIPDVKLIAMLRDPIDRLTSAYNFFHRWRGKEKFEQVIKRRSQMVSNNFYDVFLERWLQFFPRDRLLVVLHDDLKSDPQKLLREIYSFLGVNPDFVPSAQNERVLPASNPRMPGLFAGLKKFAKWLRDRDLHRVLTWAKLNPVVLKLLTRSNADKDRYDIPPEGRRELQAIYRPHIERLEILIGRDLSAWK